MTRENLDWCTYFTEDAFVYALQVEPLELSAMIHPRSGFAVAPPSIFTAMRLAVSGIVSILSGFVHVDENVVLISTPST